LSTPPVVGQSDQEALELAASTPRVSLVRTDIAPVIDGVLDEPLWEDAALIDDLTQVEPIEGAAPSQRTEVRILYDSDFIYFGIRCFDTEPDKIIAKQLQRDADLDPDDRVFIVLDPYFDHRNGYFFVVNPLGARRESLIENNSSVRDDWDGIWYAKSQIDEQGWTTEIAIPFKTISFNQATTEWGFNIQRTIRRTNEQIRWSSPVQHKSTMSVADAGVLEEIRDIDKGIGLDFKPYVKSTLRTDDVRGDGLDLDAGFDVFYKLTPSMTLALTFNTDFAETEVDERRVNLTRFPLFFPEKRDFFLQDAGIFDFGGIRMNPLPFQSRRIGLDSSGQQVDLIGGVKLTGRTGPLNLGVFTVLADDTGDVDQNLLTVGRASLNVLEESTVGLITTIGDPASNDDNTVVGGDFNYRNSHVFGDKIVQGSAFFLHSSSPDGDGDDQAWGARIGYPNDRIRATIGFTEIGDRYDAALGFVPRRGIREYFGRFRYRWRPENSWIRTIDVGFDPTVITDLNDRTESSDFELDLIAIENHAGDEFNIEYQINREVLTRPFEISPGVVIPVGDHRFDRIEASVFTSTSRPLAVGAAIQAGEFFDGDRLDTVAIIEWRPSPNLLVAFVWEQNDIDLPAGEFQVQVAQASVNFLFTPDIAWTNFIQWDNVSDSLGINSRLRWIIEPGNEIFFVVNQTFDTFGDRFDGTSTEVTTKIGWTFRF
jgi:hypothetical protein